jgi:hypothetical protein
MQSLIFCCSLTASSGCVLSLFFMLLKKLQHRAHLPTIACPCEGAGFMLISARSRSASELPLEIPKIPEIVSYGKIKVLDILSVKACYV